MWIYTVISVRRMYQFLKGFVFLEMQFPCPREEQHSDAWTPEVHLFKRNVRKYTANHNINRVVKTKQQLLT